MKTAASMLCVLLTALWLAMVPARAEDPFLQAVQAYRNGNYVEAQGMLNALHAARPEDTRVTYYLAITEAQLGRFRQARAHYEEVLVLAPNDEVAQLARQGLQYLPAESGLDLPPRFQADPAAAASIPSQAYGAAQAAPNGMTAQDMMMWQAMMSSLGGNNNANGGMAPWMMMPGMQGGQMDPSVMSTMMMNQMMGDFNFDNGDDR